MIKMIFILLFAASCFKLGYDVSDILMAYDEIDVCLNRKYETESIDEKMECEEYIYDNNEFIQDKVKFSVFNVCVICFMICVLFIII